MSIITKTAVNRCISKLKANIYDDALSKISRIEDREKINKWIQYKVNAF